MMNNPNPNHTVNALAFFASEPHDCGYLKGKTATSVYADPTVPMSSEIYSRLVEYGFRRSGEYVYVPNCTSCMACIPARIRVNAFTPNRAQKRTINYNKHLSVKYQSAVFSEEYFILYKKYLSARHSGSSMENPSRESYMEFLTSSWSNTLFFEFRDAGKLVAVAAADKLNNGLSAVYTFFDPDYKKQSLGSYAILWLIHQTASFNLNHLYLGYWIENCSKMSYKAQYTPLEIFRHGRWAVLKSSPPLNG